MAEEQKQKNRVLYNVQDLYFGLISGDTNSPRITGSNAEEIEIVRRIHRVQSVSYDFNTVREDIGILGRSSFDDNIITRPPDININITHSMEGLNNEKKMGFNVLTIGSTSSSNKEFSRNFLFSGARQQNIYLAVNQNEEDIREKARDPAQIVRLRDSGRYQEIEHSNTDKMGMVVFQNAYLTNYSIDVSVGSLPKADTSWVADNAIYLNSAANQKVPWLNSKTATVYYKQNNLNQDADLMIPGNYKRENPYFDPEYTFKPSDAQLTITTRAAESDVLIDYTFEDSRPYTVVAGADVDPSNDSYLGLSSLKVASASSLTAGSAGGIQIDLTDYPPNKGSQMGVGQFYTIEAYVKTDFPTPNLLPVIFSFSDGDNSAGNTSNLSTSTTINLNNGWTLVKKRVAIDSVKKYLFIWTTETNKNFWLDNIKIYKDAENPPLRFHTDLLQSFQLTVPLPRDNISCIGYKYYLDRAVLLPVKSTFSISMSSQDGEFPVTTSLGGDVKGDFLDNLRKDEEYDVYLTFLDDLLKEGMKFRIIGSKFESVNYGADIDNNKTSTLNFSMSNDYDYGRNVIAAEGKGLFVLDFLVNDSLIPLTDDNGEYFADPFPYDF